MKLIGSRFFIDRLTVVLRFYVWFTPPNSAKMTGVYMRQFFLRQYFRNPSHTLKSTEMVSYTECA